jgi:hypothetical protein
VLLRHDGVRGGGGIGLKYGKAIPIDDLAVDLPDMPSEVDSRPCLPK